MEQSESVEQQIDSQEIHQHSFWLYSVIVGLSVEETLRHVLPHVGEFSFDMPPDQALDIAFEFIRLALFLCLVVRFYLGSVKYFRVTHVSDNAKVEYPTKNYTVDFFYGLIHFSAFLALALSIDSKQPPNLFLFWLGFVLLYDFVWLIACRKYHTFHFIKPWAFINGLTFGLSGLLYFCTNYICSVLKTSDKVSHIVCQIFFMLPIFFFSFIDIREVLKSDPVFQKWFRGVLSRKPVA